MIFLRNDTGAVFALGRGKAEPEFRLVPLAVPAPSKFEAPRGGGKELVAALMETVVRRCLVLFGE